MCFIHASSKLACYTCDLQTETEEVNFLLLHLAIVGSTRQNQLARCTWKRTWKSISNLPGGSKVIFEGFLLAESIERFFSFHFLVSQHHTSDVKSLGLVMLEEVKR